MNQIKKFRYFNIVLTVITILILTCFAYFYYTKNIETIKIHVPLFGEIDTGITNYQLNQFIDAQKEYDNSNSNSYGKVNLVKMNLFPKIL